MRGYHTRRDGGDLKGRLRLEEGMQGSWHSAAGLRYLQIDPSVEAANLPMIICLHGRGADASDLAGLASQLHPGGYRWILPQAPLPIPIGPGQMGWAWYSLDGDRSQSIVDAREITSRFVAEVFETLPGSAGATALMGFSQGAAMALHLSLAAAESFGAVVAMSGYLPAPETVHRPLDGPSQNILIVHGTEDQTLAIDLARTTRDQLREMGLSPQYEEFAMGHQITPESLARVSDFLAETLPPHH
ncbi:MAG: hypothetical protein EXR58_07400 [Chloroflexi bacterium]|nr:hypothetical protein [Chloroflexota bacterium]